MEQKKNASARPGGLSCHGCAAPLCCKPLCLRVLDAAYISTVCATDVEHGTQLNGARPRSRGPPEPNFESGPVARRNLSAAQWRAWWCLHLESEPSPSHVDRCRTVSRAKSARRPCAASHCDRTSAPVGSGLLGPRGLGLPGHSASWPHGPTPPMCGVWANRRAVGYRCVSPVCAE